MNQWRRVAAVLVVPQAAGLLAALLLFVGYRFFHVRVQLEPLSMEIIELGSALAAGILCGVMVAKMCGTRRMMGALLAFPFFAFGAYKCLIFQSEVLSYLGVSCCRESDATLMGVLEMAVSPLAPFFMFGNHVS